MAFYIKSKETVNLCRSDDAIKLIIGFLVKKGENVKIEIEEKTILIMTEIKNYKEVWSNSVGISIEQIYINPISDQKGYNYTVELRDFVKSIPSIIRQNKLEKILM